MEDSESDLWVATVGGGINRLQPKLFHIYNTASGLLEDVSSGVCADAQGDVWLANRGGGIARISDEKVSVLHQQIGPHKFSADSVCADNRGFLWASEGKLYRFPRGHPDEIPSVSNDGKFAIFTPKDGLPDAPIRSLYADTNGAVWMGTIGGAADGLPDDNIAERARDCQDKECGG